MTYLLLAAAAAVFLLWPAKKPDIAVPSPFTLAEPPRPHPSYAGSIMALTAVRHRLVQTEQLGEQEKAAIDRLTLSLVSGSDKE